MEPQRHASLDVQLARALYKVLVAERRAARGIKPDAVAVIRRRAQKLHRRSMASPAPSDQIAAERQRRFKIRVMRLLIATLDNRRQSLTRDGVDLTATPDAFDTIIGADVYATPS